MNSAQSGINTSNLCNVTHTLVCLLFVYNIIIDNQYDIIQLVTVLDCKYNSSFSAYQLRPQAKSTTTT